MHATVVSILPWKVSVQKPGITPDTFEIEASKDKVPSLLVVADADSFIYLDGDRGSFRSPIPADKLAKSIVQDYITAFLGFDENAHPGLFWLEGKVTLEELQSKFAKEIEEIRKKQFNWFLRLIKIADDDWNKYHQHKMITDIQRFAAKSLNLQREWSVEPEPVSVVKCPACNSLIETTAIVCKHCKAIIKPEEAKKLGISFAA